MTELHECVKCGRVSKLSQELFSRSSMSYGYRYHAAGVYVCMATASCKQRRRRSRQVDQPSESLGTILKDWFSSPGYDQDKHKSCMIPNCGCDGMWHE